MMNSEQQLITALSGVYVRRTDAEITSLEAGEVPSISGRQEQKILKMLAGLDQQYQNGTLYRQQSVSRRKVKRALLVAAIVIFLLLAAVFATAIIQRQMQIDNGFVEIVFPKSAGKDRLDASFGEIPEGFELVEKKQGKLFVEYRYQRGEALLIILSEKGNDTVVFDMDDSPPQEISIHGHTAYLCVSDSVINLTWSTGSITRSIMAEIASGIKIEDVVRIAQSFDD